jgi:regulator of RNase E activity RraA
MRPDLDTPAGVMPTEETTDVEAMETTIEKTGDIHSRIGGEIATVATQETNNPTNYLLTLTA